MQRAIRTPEEIYQFIYDYNQERQRELALFDRAERMGYEIGISNEAKKFDE